MFTIFPLSYMTSRKGASVAAPVLFVIRTCTDHFVHGLFIPGFLFLSLAHCSRIEARRLTTRTRQIIDMLYRLLMILSMIKPCDSYPQHLQSALRWSYFLKLVIWFFRTVSTEC